MEKAEHVVTGGIRNSYRKGVTDMKIRALLPPEAIIVRADVQTKEAAIDLLAELHDQVGHLSDKEAYERDVWKREGECVTAIGMGMAVPHAKSDAVKQAGLAAITVPDGIDCRALDGQPTRLLFMIAAPDDGDLHLQILSSLMTLLVEEERRERLVQAATPEAFLAELEAAEA